MDAGPVELGAPKEGTGFPICISPDIVAKTSARSAAELTLPDTSVLFSVMLPEPFVFWGYGLVFINCP